MGVGHSCAAICSPGLPLLSRWFGPPFSPTVAVTVGNKRDPLSPVERADSRSFKIKHRDVKALALQVRDHVPGGNSQDSRYVLTEYPTRRKLSDNSEHFRPEVAVIPFTFLLSSHGKGLAGEAAGNNVNCSKSCPFMEILSRQRSDVAPARHVRPVLLQHLRRIIRPLALTDRCESGGFGGQVKAADTGKQ